MTDRNPDYHCATCRKYLFSTYAHEPVAPGPHYCDKCKKQADEELHEPAMPVDDEVMRDHPCA